MYDLVLSNGKNIYCGSRYWFPDLSDDLNRDEDIVIFKDFKEEERDLVKIRIFKTLKDNSIKKDKTYFNSNLTFSTLVEYLDKQDVPIEVCNLLIPEIACFLNFTIKDIKKIYPFINKLSKYKSKWKYYQIIYESYIINNSFTLTKEQREKAKQTYLTEKLH